MSLRKLLILTVSILYLLVFLGTLFISVHNFRGYLIKHTKAQTQNTASTLSFALSQYANKNDTATMETMVDAIFETGNYQQIIVKSVKGDIITSRTYSKHKQQTAPSWFIKLTKFNIPPATGLINAGWKQYGVVYVFSKTSIAYEQLWKNFLALLGWFLGTFIVVMSSLLVALNYLLTPLTKVKEQAENIAAKHFTIVKKLPWTLELRSAIEVMNKLSHRVQNLFEEQTHLTDKLRDQAYRDPLTKLGNRRYFTMQFEHVLNDKEKNFSGALLLLEINDIDKIKKAKGFEAAENYLIELASLLNETETQIDRPIICKISDITFVCVFPNISPPEAARFARELIHKISTLSTEYKKLCKVNIGVAIYKSGDTVSQLLSQADMALRSAQTKEGFNWYMYKAEEVEKLHVHTASQWKDILTEAMGTNQLILHYQPIFKFHGNEKEIMYYEALIRIADKDGKLLSAAHFLPMAESLHLMPQIDKIVISRIVEIIKTQSSNNKFSVNISPSSLLDKEFCHWLKMFLSENLDAAKNIIFELPEQCAVNQLQELKTFITDVTSYHSEITLDQFGRGFYPIQYLKSLQLTYLKIDGSFIHHINSDAQNQFFVHTLSDIAHNLEIKVIALNIETEAELEVLKTFAIDGYQGYLLGKPKEKPEV